VRGPLRIDFGLIACRRGNADAPDERLRVRADRVGAREKSGDLCARSS